jgi:hypothetical protein
LQRVGAAGTSPVQPVLVGVGPSSRRKVVSAPVISRPSWSIRSRRRSGVRWSLDVFTLKAAASNPEGLARSGRCSAGAKEGQITRGRRSDRRWRQSRRQRGRPDPASATTATAATKTSSSSLSHCIIASTQIASHCTTLHAMHATTCNDMQRRNEAKTILAGDPPGLPYRAPRPGCTQGQPRLVAPVVALAL